MRIYQHNKKSRMTNATAKTTTAKAAAKAAADTNELINHINKYKLEKAKEKKELLNKARHKAKLAIFNAKAALKKAICNRANSPTFLGIHWNFTSLNENVHRANVNLIKAEEYYAINFGLGDLEQKFKDKNVIVYTYFDSIPFSNNDDRINNSNYRCHVYQCDGKFFFYEKSSHPDDCIILFPGQRLIGIYRINKDGIYREIDGNGLVDITNLHCNITHITIIGIKNGKVITYANKEYNSNYSAYNPLIEG